MLSDIACWTGTFFGYNMLVNDMTCLPITAKQVTRFASTLRTIQMPTFMGNISGGQREFIPRLSEPRLHAG